MRQIICSVIVMFVVAVSAHEEHKHNNQNTISEEITPFPFQIGGEYELTNQFGQKYTQKDPNGNPQILFFGYVNCPSICGVAMPTMAKTTDILSGVGIEVTPVMITVDPKRDTTKTMKTKLGEIHPKFIGLTGTKNELNKTYKQFAIYPKLSFVDNENGEIFVHGQNIFVLSPNGDVQSILPPNTSVEHLAKIIQKYNAEIN